MKFYSLPKNKVFLISQKALIKKNKKTLLLKSSYEKERGRDRWELPGGILELKESLSKGLIREVKEETGLTVDIKSLFAVFDDWRKKFQLKDKRIVDARFIEIAYICSIQSSQIILSKEHTKYNWFSIDEIRKIKFSDNSSAILKKFIGFYL